LDVVAGSRYIDATLGLGGHSKEILTRGGMLLGIDQDSQALEQAKEALKGFDQKTLVHGNFADIASLAKENGFEEVSGILFDLGISSYQLDTPERGFGYRFIDAPLDLRMDIGHGESAAQLINRLSRDELYEIIASYGEEQLARGIADAICRTRSLKPFTTVGDLTEVIASLVPNEHARYGVQSRVFQALRIAVNDELGSLKKGLDGAKATLKTGGRIVVISFHSLEDRIVKQALRGSGWKVLTKHPKVPTDEESARNKRARSAKMRIAVKM
jgi:16S rRNA (cytosine1402-N4)-methyltransferase